MKRVFVDSGGFFALLAAEDRFHDHARSLFSRGDAERWRLVTTNAVVIETYSLVLARSRGGRGSALAFLDMVSDDTYQVERVRKRDDERAHLADVAEVWRRGSVVASWLLDLTAAALASDPGLEHFTGRVSDSGEGRWTLDAAVDEGVPAHVLAASLFERFSSRGEAEFQDRLLSAMRFEFGGHLEKKP